MNRIVLIALLASACGDARGVSPDAAQAGAVVDEGGGPVAGAIACRSHLGGSCVSATPVFHLARGRSSRDLVVGTAPGYIPVAAEVSEWFRPVLLQLHRGEPLAGSVVDRRDVPIPHASVLVRLPGTSLRLDTDARGAFQVVVPFAPTTVSTWAAGYSPRVVVVEGGGEVQIVLAREPTIRGWVVDGNGTAIPGAVVRVGEEEVVTGREGGFSLEVTPGLYRPRLRDAAWYGESLAVLHLGLEDDVEVRIVGRRAGLLRGRVTHGDGRPCREGTVRVGDVTLSDQPRAIPLGADGTFVAGGIGPGRSYYNVTCEGVEGAARGEFAMLTQDTTLDVTVAQEGILVGGTTVMGGRGVAAAVSLKGRGMHTVRSAGDGSFACHVPPGEYEVVANRDGAPTYWHQPVHVSVSAPVSDLQVPVVQTGRLSGRVVDAAGVAVADVPIMVTAGGATASATSDADGGFGIDAIPVGRVELRPATGRAVVGTLAPDWTDVTLVVAGTSSVSGRVLDESGRGVADAFVFISPEEAPTQFCQGLGASATTDGAGRFTIRTPLQGPYVLQACVPGGGSAVLRGVPPASSVELTIRGHATASGILLGAGEVFSIVVMGSDVAREDTFRWTSGRWEIAELPPGRYLIRGQSDGAEVEAAVVLARGRREEVTLALPERGRVRGRVGGCDGAVDRIRILARPRGAASEAIPPSVTPAPSGEFELVVPSGSVTISALPPASCGCLPWDEAVWVEPGETMSLPSFTLPRARLARTTVPGDLGLTVSSACDAPGSCVCVVDTVRANGPADVGGLGTGDRIVTVGGVPVTGVHAPRCRTYLGTPVGEQVSLETEDGRSFTLTAVSPEE